MIGIFFNEKDPVSKNTARALIDSGEFEETKENEYASKELDAKLVKSEQELLNAEFIDQLDLDVAYLITMHFSAAGIVSITTHAPGNFRNEAKLGGKPHELSVSAPIEMLGVLSAAKRLVKERQMAIQVTYEATHHGPLLKTPSLFVEIGGNEEALNNQTLAELLAKVIMEALHEGAEYEKAVIGIGSNHYPAVFSSLALEKRLAFGHIMPKYAFYNDDKTENFFMLSQAAERNKIKPELAIIDKNSFNLKEKKEIIKMLEEVGIDYEMV